MPASEAAVLGVHAVDQDDGEEADSLVGEKRLTQAQETHGERCRSGLCFAILQVVVIICVLLGLAWFVMAEDPTTSTTTLTVATTMTLTFTLPPTVTSSTQTTSTATTTTVTTTTLKAWNLAGSGLCLDPTGAPLFSSGKRDTSCRPDGGSDICERACFLEPWCMGYVTESGCTSCSFINAVELARNSLHSIARVDGETRNRCFVKESTDTHPVKSKFVGNGWCLVCSGDTCDRAPLLGGAWIPHPQRPDGGSDLCESVCSFDRNCVAYMTEDKTSCRLLDTFALAESTVQAGTKQIPKTSGRADSSCWTKGARSPEPSEAEALAALTTPLSLADAIDFAGRAFKMSFAGAALELSELCFQVQEAKYWEDLSREKGLTWAPKKPHWTEVSREQTNHPSTSLKVIFKAVELQLPLGQNEAGHLLKKWKDIEEHRHIEEGIDDGNCFATCPAASYGLLPYALTCRGGGSISDERGCTPPNPRPVVKLAKPIDPAKTKLAATVVYNGNEIRGLCGLFRSACHSNVTLHIQHTTAWKGFGQKAEMLGAFLDYLVEERPETTWIVMFVDAYDVLIQVDEEEIKRRYLASGQRVLLSSEVNCYPWQYPHCDMGINPCKLFEVGERRYPNSGGIIGEAHALREIMNLVRALPPNMLRWWPGGDQGLYGHIYLLHLFPGFEIDVDSGIFATFNPRFVKAKDPRGLSFAAGYEDGQEKPPELMLEKRPPAAAMHFAGAGTYCFYSVEAALWYNAGRPAGVQTGSGTCPLDGADHVTPGSIPTFIYDYDIPSSRFSHPRVALNFYRQRCENYQCSCERECECSSVGVNELKNCAVMP